MTNNDVFRTLLHLTGIGRDDALVVTLFKLGGIEATRSRIRSWREPQGRPRAVNMKDEVLDGFFQGLFSYRDMMIDQSVQIFNFSINMPTSGKPAENRCSPKGNANI